MRHIQPRRLKQRMFLCGNRAWTRGGLQHKHPDRHDCDGQEGEIGRGPARGLLAWRHPFAPTAVPARGLRPGRVPSPTTPRSPRRRCPPVYEPGAACTDGRVTRDRTSPECTPSALPATAAAQSAPRLRGSSRFSRRSLAPSPGRTGSARGCAAFDLYFMIRGQVEARQKRIPSAESASSRTNPADSDRRPC